MSRPAGTTTMPWGHARIRAIPLDRPWQWLAAGWTDFVRTRAIGIAYGAVLVAVSFMMTLGLYVADMAFLILPMTAGFMFVSPLFGVGLYEISRRLDAGQPVSLGIAIAAFRRNPSQILLMGLVLMLFHLAWVRIAMLLFALFFQEGAPPLDTLADTVFFLASNLPFLVTGTVVGALLAVGAFAIGAFSIPMLLDRPVGVATAMATSIAAVRENWKPLALWAVLITVFTGAAMVLFYVGLLAAWPVIGHASWHAYRDVVEPPSGHDLLP